MLTFTSVCRHLLMVCLWLTLAMTAAAASLISVSDRAHAQAYEDTSGWRKTVVNIGKAKIIDLPRDAYDVLISNPEIVEGVLRTSRQMALIGQKMGQSNVLFFDQQGREIMSLDIYVEIDTIGLRAALKRHFPDSNVQIESLLNEMVLSGSSPSSAEANDIAEFVSRYVAKASGKENLSADSGQSLVTNRIKTPEDGDQVMLRVQVAELNRKIVKRLGINWEDGLLNATKLSLSDVATSALSRTLLGSFSTEALSDADGNALYNTVNGVQTRQTGVLPNQSLSKTFSNTVNSSASTEVTLSTLLKALESHELVRILAQPSLTALSGGKASFLAGGEYPIPVGSDGGNIAIEFKKFGVGLEFVPVVLSGGRIHLNISTEVSDLASSASVTLQSVAVPSVVVRRASTTVELPSGGTIAIAGMIKQSTRRLSSGVPGLRDIPILGQLFRSEAYENEESELVILVTPYIVSHGHREDFKLPTDGFAPASDLDMYLLGSMHAKHGAGSPSQRTVFDALKAPFGFILE